MHGDTLHENIRKQDIEWISRRARQQSVTKRGSKRATIPSGNEVGENGEIQVHETELKDGRKGLILLESND